MSVRTATVFLIPFAIAAPLAFDALFFPWSFSFVGGPVLVGEWYAEIVAPRGMRRHLALEMIGHTGRCPPPCDRLNVSARLCDARGLHRYEGLGDIDNWRGTLFHARVSALESNVAVERSIHLQGRRQGDTIVAHTVLGPVRPAAGPARATVPESDAASPVSAPVLVTLRRGSEGSFERACRALRP